LVPYRHPTPPPPEPWPKPARCAHRLQHDASLHRAFAHLHRCGPRPVAFFVAELLDGLGADPAALDAVLPWRRLDPDVVAALGGTDFPPVMLRVVPPS
jgi:hypothetical protein